MMFYGWTWVGFQRTGADTDITNRWFCVISDLIVGTVSLIELFTLTEIEQPRAQK